ncbi:unnamed protein product [Lampetra planeri]
MGISGLLQFLKEASEPMNVSRYRGQTVAVDTYCWLHKGAFACADRLAKGENTNQYVFYCVKFIEMLLGCDVKPILVFDGCMLPSKKEVEKSRRERRQLNLQKGKQLLREGKVSEARACFTRCINVTPQMALEVIKAARARGVDCIVAPYEADAQLAYLNRSGIVQAVITEDSDLLAFGCDKVILKMDQSGNGVEISRSRLGRVTHLGNYFTEEKFRHMCILSGCDYLPSIPGIGLVKASKVLKLSNDPNIVKVIRKMGHYLKMNVTVPEEYIEGFVRADNTFRYQLVFDPISRQLCPLNPYPEDLDSSQLSYAGAWIDSSQALQIALGNIDINNMMKIDNFNPDTSKPVAVKSHSWYRNSQRVDSNAHMLSIWDKRYRPAGKDGVSAGNGPSPVKAKNQILPERSGCMKGKERVIVASFMKSRKTDAASKRQRQDESKVLEMDLLEQYSFSGNKKMCKSSDVTDSLPLSEGGVGGEQSCSQQQQVKHSSNVSNHKSRFTRLLNKKDQQQEIVFTPGTRSRFFYPSKEEAQSPNLVKSLSPSQTEVKSSKDQGQSEATVDQELTGSSNQSGEVSSPLKETHCLTSSAQDEGSPLSNFPENVTMTESKISSAQPRQVTATAFSWSGSTTRHAQESNSAIDKLSRFRRQPQEAVSTTNLPSTNTLNPFAQMGQRCLQTRAAGDGGGNLSETEDGHEASLSSSPPSLPRASLQSPARGIIVTSPAQDFTSCPPNPHFKGVGLSKAGKVFSGGSHSPRMFGQAKASGLSRKKPVKHNNSENLSQGSQPTLSNLWSNFQYKRETENLMSTRSTLPLSPVKSNICV